MSFALYLETVKSNLLTMYLITIWQQQVARDILGPLDGGEEQACRHFGHALRATCGNKEAKVIVKLGFKHFFSSMVMNNPHLILNSINLRNV